MSRALLGWNPLFEWDRYVGTEMTPVDAVQNARDAGQSFREYAEAFTAQHPPEDIDAEEMSNGMVNAMYQAAHNLANFRVTGNAILSDYSDAIFAHEPDDPDSYYRWVETADEQEIIDRVTAENPASS